MLQPDYSLKETKMTRARFKNLKFTESESESEPEPAFKSKNFLIHGFIRPYYLFPRHEA